MGVDETSPEQASNQNPPPPSETDETVQRMATEIADLKDKYMRAVAEMENMRRRMDRERTDLVKFSLENVFKEVLPVLDSFDRALPDDAATGSNGGQADASFREGMALVKRQLFDVFRKHGLEPIVSVGAAFDPNLHQAIQRIDSTEVDTETVGNEFARGYLLNGRLLRPAMVSVLIPSTH